jgi:hypothetical protein
MPFEAWEAIRTVSNFIDELETLEVAKETIDVLSGKVRQSNNCVVFDEIGSNLLCCSLPITIRFL